MERVVNEKNSLKWVSVNFLQRLILAPLRNVCIIEANAAVLCGVVLFIYLLKEIPKPTFAAHIVQSVFIHGS